MREYTELEANTWLHMCCKDEDAEADDAIFSEHAPALVRKRIRTYLLHGAAHAGNAIIWENWRNATWMFMRCTRRDDGRVYAKAFIGGRNHGDILRELLFTENGPRRCAELAAEGKFPVVFAFHPLHGNPREVLFQTAFDSIENWREFLCSVREDAEQENAA